MGSSVISIPISAQEAKLVFGFVILMLRLSIGSRQMLNPQKQALINPGSRTVYCLKRTCEAGSLPFRAMAGKYGLTAEL